MYKHITKLFLFIIVCISCSKVSKQNIQPNYEYLEYSKNILDYRITPKDSVDKSGLMFSDQGAWFAYSLPDSTGMIEDFSGPFLMSQQNGIWSSSSLAPIRLTIGDHPVYPKNESIIYQSAYASHLERLLDLNGIDLKESLVYLDANTVLIKYELTNNEDFNNQVTYYWENQSLKTNNLKLLSKENHLIINSNNTKAIGHILFPKTTIVKNTDSTYISEFQRLYLGPNETKSLIVSQTFIFPEYSWEKQKALIESIDFDSVLNARKQEKNNQLKALIDNRKPQFQENKYAEVLAKAHLTLQNNWRIPAG